MFISLTTKDNKKNTNMSLVLCNRVRRYNHSLKLLNVMHTGIGRLKVPV